MVSTRAETDVQQLWHDYRAVPTVGLRNRLVEHYMPLVKYNAERIWARLPDGVELDDLTSAGVFGLLDAIEAFDLTRGVKFETYCVPRIRGAMLDELRTMDWVPRLVRSKQSKVDAATKELETALGRKPTAEELSTKLGIEEGDPFGVGLSVLPAQFDLGALLLAILLALYGGFELARIAIGDQLDCFGVGSFDGGLRRLLLGHYREHCTGGQGQCDHQPVHVNSSYGSFKGRSASKPRFNRRSGLDQPRH